jgi:hypothetical protein
MFLSPPGMRTINPSTNPWLDFLLQCKYKDPTKWADTQRTKTEPCGIFTCPLVDIKLRPSATSPSKGTKKKMKEIAVQSRGEMELIWSKRCHDFTFLSDDVENEPFECALRTLLQKIVTLKDLIHIKGWNERILDLLRQDKLLEAVRGLYGHVMARAFAEAMIASTADDLASGSPSIIPTRSFTRGDAMDMAKTLWCGFEKNSESIHTDCKSTYVEVYTKSASIFTKLLPLAKECVAFV